MYGIVTRNPDELDWPAFDRGFYEVKDVTGRQEPPVPTGVNMVSCHGDTAASQDADLVPISEDGDPATRERRFFDWGYVCPTHEGYRKGLLEMIAACARRNEDVRLDDVGFPRDEYCHCDRCVERFEASDESDWSAWRDAVITDFVASARERIPGRLFLTVYPDPYPDHLSGRAGLDLAALDDYVDEFVVPIYDRAYSTTYWLEILARGFEDALSAPFSIELYAVDVDVDNLINATEVARAYAAGVYFGYDAANARAALRRMNAERGDGVTYGTPS